MLSYYPLLVDAAGGGGGGDNKPVDMSEPIDGRQSNFSVEYFENHDQGRVLLTGLFYGIAFAAGILGNGAIIYIVARNARMRTLSNVFLASLAVADLLLVLGCIPIKFLQLSSSIWEFGDFACHAFHYVQTVAAFCSVMTLTTMSLERYYAIIHPVRCRATFSMRHIKKLIATIWVLAAVCAIPVWFVYVMTPVRDEYLGGQYYWCVKVDPTHTPDDQPELKPYWWRLRLAFETYMLISILVLPALVMSFTYSRICIRLWTVVHHRTAMRYGHACNLAPTKSIHLAANGTAKVSHQPMSLSTNPPPAPPTTPRKWSIGITGNANNNNVGGGGGRGNGMPVLIPSTSSVRNRQQQSIEEDNQTVKSVIKMLVAVVLVFVVCWTPTLIFSMLRAMDIALETNEGFLKHVATVVYLLQYLNSVIDPFIYGFMSKNFRLHFKQITIQLYHRLCLCRSTARRHQHRYYYAQSRYAAPIRRVAAGASSATAAGHQEARRITLGNVSELQKYSLKPIILYADNNNNNNNNNNGTVNSVDQTPTFEFAMPTLNAAVPTASPRPTTLADLSVARESVAERLSMPVMAVTSPSTPGNGSSSMRVVMVSLEEIDDDHDDEDTTTTKLTGDKLGSTVHKRLDSYHSTTGSFTDSVVTPATGSTESN